MATFKEAFKEARKKYGAGKTFTWKGETYSTNYLEEEGSKPTSTKTTTPKTSPRPRARPASKDVMEGYRKGDIKTSSLDKPVGQNGRGDGSAEMIRRSAETALSRVEARGSKPAAKPVASREYPETDNVAIRAARAIRGAVSGAGGTSDRKDPKPSGSFTSPAQPKAPAATPSITRKDPKPSVSPTAPKQPTSPAATPSITRKGEGKGKPTKKMTAAEMKRLMEELEMQKRRSAYKSRMTLRERNQR